MLETPEADNQQPSIYRNVYEGSETNRRVLASEVEDSKSDTSALLIDNQLNVNDEDIVQTAYITEENAEIPDKEPV